MKEKRIGIDARMYSSGFTGIGRYVFELIQNLAKLDQVNKYVCFLNPPEHLNFQAPASNFEAVKVCAPHYSFAEQTQFLKALRKEKLDLMHFTHFNAPLLYGGKSVVTIHDLTLSFFPGRKMTSLLHRIGYNMVLRRSVQRASKIVAVSRNTKNDLVKILKTDPRKIKVVYNGVGDEFKPVVTTDLSRKRLEKKYQIEGGYLLYTGVWRDHKNILGLLKAIAELKKSKEWDHQLVITGKEDRIYAPEIRAAITKLNLEDNIVFPGLIPDAELLELYQGARVFVFPSFYEGFGLPPLEAMACGIPVAASNVSSIPEVCGEGNVLYFDPKNPSEMAEVIWKAWSNEQLRSELKTKGLVRAAEFSWSKMAKETLDIYKDVI